VRKLNYLLWLLILLIIAGCATRGELKALRTELNQKMDSRLDATVDSVKKELAKSSEVLEQTRKSNANTAADIAELRDGISQLRGQVETLKKDAARGIKDEEKLENILLKINFIENFLEIGKKDGLSDTGDKKKTSGNGSVKDAAKKQGKESMYSASYQLFKEGNYDKARTEFRNFLALYPKSEHSENAQFWIAECYFFEKDYEKAILEYEKLTKNFPRGKRVPYALLKQGLSFLNLKDKTSAKLLLQQVIKDYPNTNQARVARSKLQEIK